MSTAAVTTVAWSPAARTPEVLSRPGGAEQVHRFLTEDAPGGVARALQPLLPSGTGPLTCTVTRSKLKPGRKLTAYGEVSGPGVPARPFAVTWATDPGRGLPTDTPVPLPRHLLEPFAGAVTGPDGEGTAVALAPWDPAFPQLAGLYDPDHLARRLVAVGQGPLAGPVTAVPVRYRPGQRHVLRLDRADRRPGFYAKCYRDDSGRRAVTGSRQVGAALAAWGGPAGVARAAGYLEAERTVLWTRCPGEPLSHLLQTRPDLVRTAGAALRVVHDSAGVFDSRGNGRSDPGAEAAATARSAEHVSALDPGAAERLASLLRTAVDRLATRPGEHGHRLHGDFKADNVVTDGEQLRLLDFDRVTVGDPALDLGKFTADLRWWALGAGGSADAAGGSADAAVAAFLDGYGPAPRERLERARGYDVLFQLRAVGRRVLLHEPDWHGRVHVCLDEAARTLGAPS